MTTPMSADRNKKETAALVHLVFNRGMEIDEAMNLMAYSHPSTVEGYARRGRAEFRAFEEWIGRNIEIAKLAKQMQVWMDQNQ